MHSHFYPIGTARRLSRTGYTIVRCLPALEGKPWSVLTSAFVRALRPSEVVVLDSDMSAKSNAILWRVFVRLTKGGLIHSIEQEVEVDLPEDFENGYVLAQAANRPAPFQARMCHACCVRPADREAVEHRVMWLRICQQCLDRIYPEPSLTRGCYYEPDGKALR